MRLKFQRKDGVTDLRIGRLFMRTYRTRGFVGFSVRFGRYYVELCTGRRLSYAAWLHRNNCQCDDCCLERWLFCEETE